MQEVTDRHSIKALAHFPDKVTNKRIFLLIIAFIIVFVLSFSIGRYKIDVTVVLKVLFAKIFSTEHNQPSQIEIIIFNVRLPRIIAAALIGIALSVSGAVYQGIFRNPMVSPDILGSSAGAGFGAALGILSGIGYAAVSGLSFCCGLIAVCLALFAASRYKTNPVLGLVLAGIMIGSMFSAGTSFVKLVADPTDQLPAITYWLMGSLASITRKDIYILFPVIIASLIPLFLLRWRLNILTLGDNEAKSLGVNTQLIRLCVIIFSTLMTSICVAYSGMIGFVGLVIPHFARKMIGCDFKKLLPTAALLGGIFLIVVDDIARSLCSTEIPIGILTSFTGAPFFIHLLVKGDSK